MTGARGRVSFRRILAGLRDDPAMRLKFAAILCDSSSTHYAAALRVLVAYDDDAPTSVSREARRARVDALITAAERCQLASRGG